ncbi:MAG: thioredoxin family protein [Chitinophagaceae bacterium]|nr:thioredoxin family protein [Chitinophagaceae bacterium]
MKRLFFCTLLAIGFCLNLTAQTSYEVIVDRDGSKILKGIITRDLLEKDTSFNWYASNLKGYSPNADALNGLKKFGDSIQLLVFMGTWCDDSRYIIPKFYSLLDATAFPKEKITMIGVDRSKKSHSNLTDALNIINVPTILVMKKGREVGRVVEFGKYGTFDKELGEIILSIGTTAH